MLAVARPVTVLEGYKDIAAFLEQVWGRTVSSDVAYRCVKTSYDPLPAWVHRRRVFADAERVRAWAERQPMWRSRLDG